jgi:hypothetical protein
VVRVSRCHRARDIRDVVETGERRLSNPSHRHNKTWKDLYKPQGQAGSESSHIGERGAALAPRIVSSHTEPGDGADPVLYTLIGWAAPTGLR